MEGNIIDINKYYSEIANAAPKEIPFCVCPLHEIKNGYPSHYGSGILIKIGIDHFLITASHVFEDMRLYIPCPPNIHCQINGAFLSTRGPSSIYKNDIIDISVGKLNPNTIECLKLHYKFLGIEKIRINHQISNVLSYIIIGYPKGRTKRNPVKKELYCNPFTYNTIACKDEMYPKTGMDKRFNILVEYNKKNINTYNPKNKIQGPDLRGMSGGALFYVPLELKRPEDPIKFYLVGILNYFVDQQNVIRATRIDFVTEIIRTRFNINIPNSSIINLKTEIQ